MSIVNSFWGLQEISPCQPGAHLAVARLFISFADKTTTHFQKLDLTRSLRVPKPISIGPKGQVCRFLSFPFISDIHCTKEGFIYV